MRYRIERYPNPDCLGIHTDFMMPTVYAHFGAIETCWCPPLDEEDTAFATALLAIDGIVSMSISKYRVHLVKAPLFDWPPIVREVVEILRGRFVPHGQLEEAGQPMRRMSL